MDHLNANEVKGLVHRTSLRLFAKFPQLRASHEFEDFEQMMWMEWMRVKDRFDPAHGYHFTTYFGTCCRNRVLKMVNARRPDVEFDTDVAESQPDDFKSSEDMLAESRVRSRAFERVDPQMRKIAELLIEDPEILQREARAQAAKAALTSALNGGAGKEPELPEITLPLLFRVMGLHRSRGYHLVAQFKETLDEYL
ncbi:sigma factor [Paracoccus litorisediminis]|uniref:RNA polymerase sigma-70 region 2 domain-containing protein n=1 Tax=Paracoccus litorisediminis TaxID=2006130 RepID=A0A844HUA3_9RHOB|nr:sigma factor [Paracoccus litorisediminis]MTH61092.1 hypothetical protein [Paracoccus litorisediminis]